MSRRAELHAAGDALPLPHPHSWWLWPGRLLASAHPGVEGARLDACLQAGLTHFIDLTEPHEPLPAYAGTRPALVHQRFPIPDFGVPDRERLRAALAAIDAALADGRGVVLHCRGGIGRSGTVAACWLVGQGEGGEAALALVAHKYRAAAQSATAPHAPETPAQRAFVRAWARCR